MSDHVIAFDVDIRKMKDDGLESAVTKAYAEVERLLRSCGFTGKIQGSTYKSTNDNGINLLIEFLSRKGMLPCSVYMRRRYISSDAMTTATLPRGCARETTKGEQNKSY